MANISKIMYIEDENNATEFSPIVDIESYDNISSTTGNTLTEDIENIHDNSTITIPSEDLGPHYGVYLDKYYNINRCVGIGYKTIYADIPRYSNSMIHVDKGSVMASLGSPIGSPLYLNNGTLTACDNRLMSLTKYYNLNKNTSTLNQVTINKDSSYSPNYTLQFNQTNNWGNGNIYIPASYYYLKLSFSIKTGNNQNGYFDIWISDSSASNSPYDLFSIETIIGNGIYERYSFELCISDDFGKNSGRTLYFHFKSTKTTLYIDANSFNVELIDLIA